MIRALQPRAIKFSTSEICLLESAWASALIYLAPSFSSCPFIAASSVFQRSSWKFDQLTPTVSDFAKAAPLTTVSTATAINVKPTPFKIFFMLESPFVDGYALEGRLIENAAQVTLPLAITLV